MLLSLTQFILLIFLLFALSRVFLRFRDSSISLFGFIFWSALFCFAIVTVLIPDLSSYVAKVIGIGRGVDAVVYVSIVMLFYLIFRLHVFIEDLRHEISDLISKLALKEHNQRDDKTTKN